MRYKTNPNHIGPIVLAFFMVTALVKYSTEAIYQAIVDEPPVAVQQFSPER